MDLGAVEFSWLKYPGSLGPRHHSSGRRNVHPRTHRQLVGSYQTFLVLKHFNEFEISMGRILAEKSISVQIFDQAHK